MPTLDFKPTYKRVPSDYAALVQFDQHRVTRETAVRQLAALVDAPDAFFPP